MFNNSRQLPIRNSPLCLTILTDVTTLTPRGGLFSQNHPAMSCFAASPAPCAPCQQACQAPCSTSYTQRCFYQPVTTYTTQTFYEPVTTTQTSYYYEPVTSYRTSYYYDSCSCSYYQASTPVTSYE